ncbi:MAG TPA: hypothetical protein VMT20_07780 [Terriglobia bacterium]|nr:hypothetical protein [Terriglobia bacterium]
MKSPKQAQLICIDCQQLMDPNGEPFSDENLKLLLRLVEREIEGAMDSYELELDERTKTGEARLAELAPSVEDRWLNLQIDRLRRAIDRNKRVLPKVLEVAYGRKTRSAEAGPRREDDDEKKDTNQSQEVL